MSAPKKSAKNSTSTAHAVAHAGTTTQEDPMSPDTTSLTALPTLAAVLPYITQCLALLDQIEKALPDSPAFTSSAKRTKAKARKGGDQYAPRLISLARQYGVNLKLVPIDTMEKNAAEAAQLAPLLQRVEHVTKRVADRLFATRSSSWSDASKLYSVLKRLSRDDGNLESGLAPVEQFFTNRHPLVRKNHPKTAKGKAALAAEKAGAAKEPVTEPKTEPAEVAPPPTQAAGAAPPANVEASG